MRSIKIVLSNERIVPNSGLYLVNKILSKSNLVKMINKIKSGKRSQNINRIIGVEIMKGKDTPVRHSTVQRRRVRTIIENILTIAGHLTEHARKFKLSLGRSNGWRISFMRLCDAF